jgi:protein arginine N-methyltransferase 5
VIVGVEVDHVVDLSKEIDVISDEAFDFIVAPLAHPLNERQVFGGDKSFLSQNLPFTRSDMIMAGQDWRAMVIGRVSSWIRPDSANAKIRDNSIKILEQEVSWASHLGITACILPQMGESSANYSRAVLSLLSKTHGLHQWVQVPIIPHEVDLALRNKKLAIQAKEAALNATQPKTSIPGMTPTAMPSSSSASTTSAKLVSKSKGEAVEVSAEDAVKTWESWNRFRLQCHHHAKLGVALELTENMPSLVEQARWFAEPLKAVLIPTRIFITNSKGAPVLSSAHVAFLHKVFLHNVQVIITGSPVHGSPASRGIYQQYITHVFSKTPALSKADSFCQSYWDYLQDPLQPLMDNLESATYEVFERDPVKYQQYEDAIYRAILDISKRKKETISQKKREHDEANETEKIVSGEVASETKPLSKASSSASTSSAGWKLDEMLVVMVVGAGRGPIVEAAMRAEQRAKIPIKLYALDKNPNALVTMRSKQLTSERWKMVNIVHQDMREWIAPEYADILVSEMLGSFGDNELSPECLQGAERLIEPNHGISIPAWYTSFLAPISTCKLWNELSVQYESNKAFETSYVVKLHNFFELETPKPVFTFSHPSPTPFNNNRYISLEFEAPTSTLLHGFSGYFDCCLYKDVHISIEPKSHTTDMVSWFPIWFPLKTPITVKKGDRISIHIWRYSGGGKVWYEWSFSNPISSPIHNPGGRSCAIGL